MTWEHFREKATYDWADSTMLGMISKIDSLGPADQIIEMIDYHLDDESSTRLMNRAI